jgi:hypothetical protein
LLAVNQQHNWMEEQIDIQGELERLNSRHPFAPFTIIMVSGDRYEVNVDRMDIARYG